jgi:hypothetical protein
LQRWVDDTAQRELTGLCEVIQGGVGVDGVGVGVGDIFEVDSEQVVDGSREELAEENRIVKEGSASANEDIL